MVQKKQPTAFEKAEQQYQKDKKAVDDTLKELQKASDEIMRGRTEEGFLKGKAKKKLKAKNDKKVKDYDAKSKKYERLQETLKKSEATYKKLKGYEDNKNAVSAKVSEQRSGWHNEGTAAIFRTDGHSSNIIFISPGDGESEAQQSTVTSYAVDEGAPRSNYARTSSKTIQVSGTITGNTRAEANKKYEQLKYWSDHHTELTYRGSFTYHHLIISDLQQNFSEMLLTDLKVSITFTYVTAAEITISTGKTSKVKKSKSSKTTQGTRNKEYIAITIKWGDTLWGLSQKYGKSIAWLQKVNHIKNPNLIYAGRTLYVGEKEKKTAKKMRVK